jgi:hypothetical protein
MKLKLEDEWIPADRLQVGAPSVPSFLTKPEEYLQDLRTCVISAFETAAGPRLCTLLGHLWGLQLSFKI